MIKVFTCLLFSTLLILNSCADTITPEYNILDPKNPNYSPTAPKIGVVSFSSIPIGIKIIWIDNSLGEIKFEIERSDSINNNFIKVGEVPADSNLFIDTFVPKLNHLYYYRIKAISENGKFTSSPERTYLTNMFNAPTSLKIIHQNSSSVTLTWVDQSPFEDGFTIKMREVKNPVSNFEILDSVEQNVRGLIIENLDTTKIYEYKVTAFNSYYQVDSDIISSIFGIVGEDTPNISGNFGTPIDFSPKSNVLANGADLTGYKVKFYNYDNAILTTTSYTDYLVKYAPDGSKIALLDNKSSGANNAKILNANTLLVEKVLPYYATQLAFSPDGTRMILLSEAETKLRLIDLQSSNLIWEIPTATYKNVMFNNQGDKIICNDAYNRIIFLNVSDGSTLNYIYSQSGYVTDFTTTKDDKYLLLIAPVNSSLQYGWLELWDLQTFSFVQRIGYGKHLTISPDNKLIALSTDQDADMYRISDFEKVGFRITGWNEIKFMCFNYQSNLLGANFTSYSPRIVKLLKKWIARE
jgi:hypothetical protein